MGYRSLYALLFVATFPAMAQQAPDAGQALQQLQPRELRPEPSAPEIELTTPAERPTPAGGPVVMLQGVRLAGNSRFTEAELLALLGDVKGKAFDLAGLRGLARRITLFYREQGYPFAHALIPAQHLGEGILTLQIIEGRYGRVEAQGAFAGQAQGFLAALEPGEVIEKAPLERAVTLLSDQPGVRISPIIRPGREVGEGDLVVEVAREPTLKGGVSLDNHGNRYTGRQRIRADLRADSPFMLGDQLRGGLIYTEEGMWQGSLTYGMRLGNGGLRASLGYAHTYYELGDDFAALDAHGTADVSTLGFAYPLLSSPQARLALGLTYQHKALDDRQDASATQSEKQSDVLPVTLQFERRDEQGVTYGSLAYTAGELQLDSTLEAADRASGMDTRGHFTKWNLDVARLQGTGMAGLNLYGRFSGQWASKNLDSSEGFILGGATGVRAYPQGEGAGDEGWLVQIEVRYRLGAAQPYLFHDHGEVALNARPGQITPLLEQNSRVVAGTGLGVRYQSGRWQLDGALAWRTRGGAPESDSRDDVPRVWLMGGWRF